MTNHEYKEGDLVQHEDGRVLPFVDYNINGGICIDYKSGFNIWWEPDKCRPYVKPEEPTPFTECMPTKEDVDNRGCVLSCLPDGRRALRRLEDVTSSGATAWLRTPAWTKRKPLRVNCCECEFHGAVNIHGIDISACFKHRSFSPDPHYIDDTPCHLWEENDD